MRRAPAAAGIVTRPAPSQAHAVPESEPGHPMPSQADDL
jgi:hypothetical protein